MRLQRRWSANPLIEGWLWKESKTGRRQTKRESIEQQQQQDELRKQQQRFDFQQIESENYICCKPIGTDNRPNVKLCCAVLLDRVCVVRTLPLLQAHTQADAFSRTRFVSKPIGVGSNDEVSAREVACRLFASLVPPIDWCVLSELLLAPNY